MESERYDSQRNVKSRNVGSTISFETNNTETQTPP